MTWESGEKLTPETLIWTLSGFYYQLFCSGTYYLIGSFQGKAEYPSDRILK